MDSNEERVQKHVGVNSPDQRREVPTERTERGLRLSPGTIAIIAIHAVTAIAVVLFSLKVSHRLISISDRTGVLVLNRQESSTLSFVVWIVIGLVIGLMRRKIRNKPGGGLEPVWLVGFVVA